MVGIRCVLSDKITDGKCQIYIRATITRTYRPMLKTDIFVNPRFFRNGKIMENVVGRVSEKNRLEVSESKQKLDLYCSYLESLVHQHPKKVMDKEWLRVEMQKCRFSLDYVPYQSNSVSLHEIKKVISSGKYQKSIYEFIDKYALEKGLSKSRIMKYNVLKRRLIRYESFEYYMGDNTFCMSPESLDEDILNRFQTFCLRQKDLSVSYPLIFDAIEKKLAEKAPYVNGETKPQLNNICQNTCIEMMSDLKALVNWLISKSVITEDPFAQISIKPRHFTPRPVFITLDERKKLAALDLHNNRKLDVQRDIFIFHCLVGCRYGDLIKLTDENVIEGKFLQYVPDKTKKTVNPIIPKVPLTEEARTLMTKYKGMDKKGRLFPFATNTHYNDCLKELFTLAGLTRTVQVLNPQTREPISVPLNQYVSSHLARRTFIGNLYNKVKDPSIISVMSGHVEHSKAFSRYRDIGDDVRIDLIDKIK